MKRILLAALLGLQMVALAPALAAADDLATGEVRRIDKAEKKVTLRHGELRAVQMPPMTMTFPVRDAKSLDALKIGDKVKFKVAKQPDGAIVVTEIAPER